MQPAGYSGTSLAKKLGIKPGYKLKLVNQPDHYFQLFADLPADIQELTDKKTKKDFIHYFTTSAAALTKEIKQLRLEIEENGMIWVSWPKQTAKTATDLNGNIVREIGKKNGLVDVKVCAVDEKWSGLKFVIPLKDRNFGS